MKTEKRLFKVLIFISAVVFIFCVFFFGWTLIIERSVDKTSSWAEAIGSLAAVVVALWGTMWNDIKRKEKRYGELSREIKRLKKMYSKLSAAEGYDPKEYLQEHPNLSYADTWSQHWHDYIPQLIELKNVLEENGEYIQSLNDFIKYIDDGNTKALNAQLQSPLLHLRMIYEWKEKQLKSME
ncbi:hypothetical protein [Limosilactobacillus reuteri]|uniref:hypothetical protein n=1 Tax=Limosilactobacillus reuteri TaxID=1598 RepID=UPI001C5B8E01|nr:hypothetical protein [Limosilactobacillus reuteri]MBW3349580.1 hypothetical protein [Limosilactobacillus reuteri]UUW69464.1 hypothetical protein NUJ10_05140 [Limosilactobacillus reuteri]